MSVYDFIVIGSGPAGKRAAVQAAKLGKSVLVVEKGRRVGGVSVHTGTIPSKTLRETVLNLTGWRERMHELAITESVVDLVAERTSGRRVVAVHVRVGRLSGVVPDSMAFCFDLATAGTALAGSRLDIEEIRQWVGADSLAYLDLAALKEATGAPDAGFCDACLTGDYPVAVPVTLSKGVLERTRG